MLLGGIDGVGFEWLLIATSWIDTDGMHVGLKAVVDLDVRVNSPNRMNLKNPTQQAAHSRMFW